MRLSFIADQATRVSTQQNFAAAVKKGDVKQARTILWSLASYSNDPKVRASVLAPVMPGLLASHRETMTLVFDANTPVEVA